MAGQDFGFIWERQQSGFDGVDELAEVAAGQVSSADAAGKEGVAGDEQLEGGKMQADRSLCVARSVDHLRWTGLDPDTQAIVERFVGRSRLRGRDTHPAGLLVHHFQQRQVVLVEQDGCAGKPLELERSSYMVNVGVGDENLLELETEFGQAAMDAADLVAGIDNNSLSRLRIAKDGAVALQRADGEGFQNESM